MLAASQTDFAQSLLDPDRPVPAGLMAHTSQRPVRRFAVYRNNVAIALTQALADTFPVVKQLVGDEFFDAMAGVYLREQPPRSPVLAR